jgi:hypothetical protein
MANYAVTDHVTVQGSMVEVAALLETYLETVTNTFTIRLLQIEPVGSGQFIGVCIHNAA